ncbi:hypothetical protein RRG08_035479 [Elysia crispata]|uniref:G-protein coupled receptors family 1 profile domain-containing protein n=1 Tax=Elysia crispata TaxID=231223 RepID=A0AAE1ARH4_9GAST|nr:hypothetical protein RRG08_035479 [Elysia crispata]
MNASTSVDLVSASMGKSLVSDNIAKYIMVTMSFMILPFGVPAIFLNILNVHVFVNTKLDSVTNCYLSLALSDLISMLAISNATVFNIINAFGVNWGRNLPTYTYLLTYGHSLAIDITSATTTYIALQRGLCVTLPFLTRHAFNKNRSLVICVSIFLMMLAFTLPRYATLKLISIPDPADTRVSLL